MTQEEKVACSAYLDNRDNDRTCNEYRLLKELLYSQMPSPKSKRLKIGMLVLLIMTLIFGICLHVSCLWALQDGRHGATLSNYVFGLVLIVFSIGCMYGNYLHKPFVKWLFHVRGDLSKLY